MPSPRRQVWEGTGKVPVPRTTRASNAVALPSNLVAVVVEGRLDVVVFEGRGEAWDVLAFGSAFDFEADLLLFLGAGLAKDDDGAEGFGVDAGHQKGVAAFEILPKLADLNLARAHRRKRL
jgi:hypothetical protein